MPAIIPIKSCSQIQEEYAVGESSSYRRDEAIRNASLAAMQLKLAAKDGYEPPLQH